MCKHGTEKMVRLCRPREASGRVIAPVDACIANEIQMLNNNGVVTIGCCCGHGESAPLAFILNESVDVVIDLGYFPLVREFPESKMIILKGELE